jgi:SEC-C motif-containing protein
MRSRYTAYVRQDEAYLLRTWAPSSRPDSLELEGIAWQGLDVRATQAGGPDDATGTVTFVAHFHADDAAAGGESMHEVSRFVRDGEAWLYLDGDADGSG